jgi:anhydro-N-acetylmuramic acid kinase
MSTFGKILIGAMSGTSADGVDAAAVSISGSGLEMTAQLLQFVHVDYPTQLKQEIFIARAAKAVSWADVAGLTARITGFYIEAVEKIDSIHRSKASAIAAHGQTFFHDPPNTLQLLDPALLSARTGLAVVSDFRRADCAAGGQGAPLVPFADYLLFRHPEKNRVLLNIGGIANLTWLRAGGTINEMIAFDTGPGNCVSDFLMRQHDPSGPGYDAGGSIAAAGKYHFATAFGLARQKYVFSPPPKSTDTAQMLELFQNVARDQLTSLSLNDQLATACAATAHSIKMSVDLGVQNWWKHSVDEIIVSGGGTQNACMMQLLREAFQTTAIAINVLPDELAQAKEAIAFALLGAATLDGEPSNVPSVTGAARRVILGSITPKP